MPQMAPMNWLLLYIMFSLLFIMMIIMNYYTFLYTPNFNIKKNKKIQINWKW